MGCTHPGTPREIVERYDGRRLVRYFCRKCDAELGSYEHEVPEDRPQ